MGIREMSDDDLVVEYKALHRAVYVDDTYSLGDMGRLVILENELIRRGYDIIETVEVVKSERGR